MLRFPSFSIQQHEDALDSVSRFLSLDHFVVELETGLPPGVFGQSAKGGDAGAKA